MYNLSLDKSQHNILHARRKKLSDDHTSPTHTKERVIVPDVRRHLFSMVEASKAYAEATSSMVKFSIVENDQMEKDLQEARQRIEQLAGSTMTEMKKSIVVEISTLEATIWTMYNIFVTV